MNIRGTKFYGKQTGIKNKTEITILHLYRYYLCSLTCLITTWHLSVCMAACMQYDNVLSSDRESSFSMYGHKCSEDAVEFVCRSSGQWQGHRMK